MLTVAKLPPDLAFQTDSGKGESYEFERDSEVSLTPALHDLRLRHSQTLADTASRFVLAGIFTAASRPLAVPDCGVFTDARYVNRKGAHDEPSEGRSRATVPNAGQNILGFRAKITDVVSS